MTTKNHSEVAASGRHAPHNLEYASKTTRINAVVTSANLYQWARQDVPESFWILLDGSPVTWAQVLAGDAADRLDIEILEGGVLKQCLAPVELADGEYYDLPEDSVGFGTFMAVEIGAATAPEIARVTWNINGNVASVFLTANAAITDTAGKFCAVDNGSTMRIINNLGYSIYMLFDLDYCLNYLT